MKNLSTFAAIVFTTTLALPALADPPEGRGWKKHKHERHETKEEYWDGNCKVERKWERNGDYKEERKCKGAHEYAYREPGARVVVELPPWFDHRREEPVYQPDWRPAPQPTATRCNSAQVGRVLGGLIGGVLGHQIGDGRGNTAATIGGAIAGVLIGGEVGKRMDARNQACVAQALEFAPNGQRISWQGESGEEYAVVPGAIEKRGDTYCRSFTAEVQGGNRSDGTACRRADGTWVRSI
ncbi:glycine zipper 2TM domain-containing protein [Microbulbifer rhizosphaerae]|uniref:Surface antigen n=1 Tax=Microbulbifer rhizosphaerae TaxID=1562603 RepID=A0A7W4WFN2_9GAMM|nr:glycine zipper 2TM domain-containing protein [Microbulbifer rhizosphaerae]MBB3063346.1 surface antigen [Microbulbifer rhizosphaerae]